jgi:glutamyl-Q tRNA(Asp) synthetase
MSVVTRFAPSPTGRLHLGHAWSAIAAHDFARTHGGAFLLRIEDIDGTRSRAEHVAGILEDLTWLDRYAAALETLKEAGLLYPCFCTRADIAASVAAAHGPADSVYPGTCRGLDARGRMDEPHCWRIDMAAAVARAGPLQWHDVTAGVVAADPAAHGDVVLARKDAPASYHLAVTVDDAAQGVTDIVRGTDLFTATDVHRLLQALLGLPTPRYHHHPLLTDASGRRLAKRDRAATLADLRAGGMAGAELAAMLRAGRLPIGFGTADP